MVRHVLVATGLRCSLGPHGRSLFCSLAFFTLTASDAMSFHHAPVVSFFGDLTRGREKGKGLVVSTVLSFSGRLK